MTNKEIEKTLEFLYTHNKNYTKEQYYAIEELYDDFKDKTYDRKKYELGKDRIREKAVEYSIKSADENYSYGELMEITNYFEKQGRKYGLLKEFRENGII